MAVMLSITKINLRYYFAVLQSSAFFYFTEENYLTEYVILLPCPIFDPAGFLCIWLVHIKQLLNGRRKRFDA